MAIEWLPPGTLFMSVASSFRGPALMVAVSDEESSGDWGSGAACARPVDVTLDPDPSNVWIFTEDEIGEVYGLPPETMTREEVERWLRS